jgi:putative peptide zinc metalloprotease protein
MKAPNASEVERRKKVRIRIRLDLDIAPQKYEGRTYYVVKDPVSLRYYRFKEQEHFLINLMDGTHTLDDAQKRFELRFRPERLTLEDLEGFAQQLLTAGLAQNESPTAGKQLFDRRKKRRRSEIMQALTNILYIKIPVFDPDRLLNWMLKYTRWIFTLTFLFLSVCLWLSAILLVLTHFQTFRERLPSMHEFFTFKNVAIMWISLGVVKVIHEFGHGLSCKAFGGEVHEMGALFLVFSPCLYCNVSDAWTLPDKWKRILISFAGIYVEFILIAPIATFIWWNTPANPWLNNIALNIMIVCSVSTVVFNANPLMRYDGYYILADWLEIPNLRDRSNRYLQRLVMEHCLGIEVQPEPYMALWRRILFVGYAIISYIYRWVVTFSILWFMAYWLKPYKLGVISGMLAMAAAASMVGWPLYRLGKNIHKRGRLPDMKAFRATVSAAVVVAVVIAFFTVPLPIGRIRHPALVQVQPEAEVKVYAPMIGGVLEALYVKDGQRVEKGDALAEFRDLDLESQLQEAKAQYDIANEEFRSLQRDINEPNLDKADRSKMENQMAKARGERDRWYRMIGVYENNLKDLRVFAPIAGVVMSPPRIDEIGKYWDKGQPTPFCAIGDPTQLRALMPVGPADYRLLQEDMNEAGQLDVVIRVQGRDSHTWKGVIAHMPESEAKQIPVQLTNKAGGDIAVKPGTQPGVYIPQSQEYLVSINILDPDNAIWPGSMAQVKVQCQWRTAAWAVWRWFNKNFGDVLL